MLLKVTGNLDSCCHVSTQLLQAWSRVCTVQSRQQGYVAAHHSFACKPPGNVPLEGTPLAGLACHSWPPAHRAAAATDMHVTFIDLHRISVQLQCSSACGPSHIESMKCRQTFTISHKYGMKFRDGMTAAASKKLQTIL